VIFWTGWEEGREGVGLPWVLVGEEKIVQREKLNVDEETVKEGAPNR